MCNMIIKEVNRTSFSPLCFNFGLLKLLVLEEVSETLTFILCVSETGIGLDPILKERWG